VRHEMDGGMSVKLSWCPGTPLLVRKNTGELYPEHLAIGWNQHTGFSMVVRGMILPAVSIRLVSLWLKLVQSIGHPGRAPFSECKNPL
jgi:hypothetical protein